METLPFKTITENGCHEGEGLDKRGSFTASLPISKGLGVHVAAT